MIYKKKGEKYNIWLHVDAAYAGNFEKFLF